MQLVSATFVDHDEAMLAVKELREGLGVDEIEVASLAQVDPPLADPLLVEAHVAAEDEAVVRDLLRAHGAALLSGSFAAISLSAAAPFSLS